MYGNVQRKIITNSREAWSLAGVAKRLSFAIDNMNLPIANLNVDTPGGGNVNVFRHGSMEIWNLKSGGGRIIFAYISSAKAHILNPATGKETLAFTTPSVENAYVTDIDGENLHVWIDEWEPGTIKYQKYSPAGSLILDRTLIDGYITALSGYKNYSAYVYWSYVGDYFYLSFYKEEVLIKTITYNSSPSGWDDAKIRKVRVTKNGFYVLFSYALASHSTYLVYYMHVDRYDLEGNLLASSTPTWEWISYNMRISDTICVYESELTDGISVTYRLRVLSADKLEEIKTFDTGIGAYNYTFSIAGIDSDNDHIYVLKVHYYDDTDRHLFSFTKEGKLLKDVLLVAESIPETWEVLAGSLGRIS